MALSNLTIMDNVFGVIDNPSLPTSQAETIAYDVFTYYISVYISGNAP